MAEQAALVGEPDLGAVGELAGLAEVVHERGAEQQVRIQTRVQLGALERERADRDRVLEQPAEVGVVAGARARRAAPLGAQRGVAEQALEQAAIGRVVDLAGEVLEEAVELVEVAVGDGQEGRRIRLLGPCDRPHLELQLVAEALDAPGDAHEVAALEAPREHVRVAERARVDRARAVAQLEREIRRAGACRQPVLARAGEDRVDGVAGAQAGDRDAVRRCVNTGARGGRGTVDSMQPLRWERRPDGLRAPALVCAFKGWNDAGESATSALAFVAGSLGAESFATIDPEEFVDFQSTRPMVRLEDGITRTIDWPEFEIHAVRIPRAPRDLVLLSGPEPALRWRTFSRRSSTSPRRSESRWRCCSARCWPTSRTRGRSRSRRTRPTRA